MVVLNRSLFSLQTNTMCQSLSVLQWWNENANFKVKSFNNVHDIFNPSLFICLGFFDREVHPFAFLWLSGVTAATSNHHTHRVEH